MPRGECSGYRHCRLLLLHVGTRILAMRHDLCL
jgi:hypothetical protein